MTDTPTKRKIEAITIADGDWEDNPTTHIKGYGANHTLCGWVDAPHEYVTVSKITCKHCLNVMKHVKSLVKGKDW